MKKMVEKAWLNSTTNFQNGKMVEKAWSVCITSSFSSFPCSLSGCMRESRNAAIDHQVRVSFAMLYIVFPDATASTCFPHRVCWTLCLLTGSGIGSHQFFHQRVMFFLWLFVTMILYAFCACLFVLLNHYNFLQCVCELKLMMQINSETDLSVLNDDWDSKHYCKVSSYYHQQ